MTNMMIINCGHAYPPRLPELLRKPLKLVSSPTSLNNSRNFWFCVSYIIPIRWWLKTDELSDVTSNNMDPIHEPWNRYDIVILAAWRSTNKKLLIWSTALEATEKIGCHSCTIIQGNHPRYNQRKKYKVQFIESWQNTWRNSDLLTRFVVNSKLSAKTCIL